MARRSSKGKRFSPKRPKWMKPGKHHRLKQTKKTK